MISAVPPPPGAVTVNAILVVCVVPPAVPLTITVYVPGEVVELVLMVSAEEPPPGAAMDVGLKLDEAPIGNPLASSEIAELNPPITVVVTVPLIGLPAVTAKLDGAEIVKSGFGFPGLKMMSSSGGSSPPFGAPPVCPCRKSK